MKRSVANGIILAVIAAVILTLVCVSIMNPLLHLMNTPSDIFRDAYTYIMGNQHRTHGEYLLQPVFLLSACGGKQSGPAFFPDIFRLSERGSGSAFYHPRRYGRSEGAAWATNLSQAISAVLCVGYIWVKVPSLKPDREHWKIHGMTRETSLRPGSRWRSSSRSPHRGL